MRMTSRTCAAVLLGLALLAGCGQSDDDETEGGSSVSRADDSRSDADGFLAAIDMPMAMLLLERTPSDSELLTAGEQFCDRWREAQEDAAQMDGPLFVRRDLEDELTGDDLILLDLIYFPAEDYLCPELMD